MKRPFWLLVPLLALLLTAASANAGYPGTVVPLFAFHAIFLTMLALTFSARHSYAYTALVAFLTLGFWTKFLLHIALDVRLVESVGAFSGTPAEWDAVMWAATCGALGVVTARLVTVRALRVSSASWQLERSVPPWFLARRRLIWIATLVVVVVSAALNWYLDIWQIGVGNRRILPLRLNVAVSWWFSMAAAMWLATLVEFDRRTKGLSSGGAWLFAPIVEAVTSSTTTLSRGLFVMRMLPYYLVFAVERLRGIRLITLPTFTVLVCATLVGMVVCLSSVSWLRLTIYPRARMAEDVPIVNAGRPVEVVEVVPARPAPQAGGGRAADSGPREAAGPSAAPGAQATVVPPPAVIVTTGGTPSRRQLRLAAREVAGLFVTRWIGLEGVMAVTAYQGRGYPLLVDAIWEDPKLGADSLYQRIAGNPYRRIEGFRFLTLPGVAAVLAYSDSVAIVFAGMVFVTLIAIGTEVVVTRLLNNAFLSSVIAVGLANVIVQMNFPYLFGVFLVELWISVFVLWRVLGTGYPRARTVAAEPPAVD